ncbi:MAG TPA: cytochrome c-type biogenesis protein [Gemmatimonadaceae bacterium]|nr:cytochrome c-type biogenesis protein [Gemmatimonadaceae bacterium]
MAQPPVTGTPSRPRMRRGLDWAGRVLLVVATITFVVMLCAPRARAAQNPAAAGVSHDAELEAQVRRLSAELRCPVCQGLSLADSPSELSREMKDVVRAQLVAGKSPEEVKEYFVGRYGEWILLEPKPHGWNLLVYVLPLMALLAGLGGVFYVARRWATAGVVAEEEPATSVETVGAPEVASRSE